MDNLGEVFKKAREEKGLTIKDVSIQTNIGSKFIKAIENNDFTVFPGEAYTVGFIRNYAEFLKVEPEKVIKLFYTNQIAESETPIEELVAPTKPRLNPIPIILFVVLIIGVGVGIFFIVKGRANTSNTNESGQNISAENTNVPEKSNNQTKNINFADLPIYSKKTIGDKVFISIATKKLSIEIKNIDKKSIKVIFSSIGDNDFLVNMRREFNIDLNKELRFDLERNRTYDFSVGVEEIPNQAQAKVFIKKIDAPYESQRYYDYFTYTKPDQATLTQLQQNKENTSEKTETTENTQNNTTNNTRNVASNVKLNINLTNSMQRDSIIYIWVRKDNSAQIQTVKLNKNQSVNLKADSKITLDTNNLFGLNIKINGRKINTKNLTNEGGIGKLRFWIEKNPQGKTEIKWEINR